MQTQTAFSAAFARASGLPARDIEFRAAIEVALAKFTNNGGRIERAQSLFDEAADKLRGAGQAASAATASVRAPAAPQTHDEAKGQTRIAAKAADVAPFASSAERQGPGHTPAAAKALPHAPAPLSPIDRDARRGVAVIIAKSVLDTHRLLDGTPIGDVAWSSLDRRIAAGGRETALLKLIRSSGVPPDANAPVRAIVTAHALQRMIQKAAEIADAQ